MTLNLARLGLVFFVALPIGANAETADLPPLPKRNASGRRPGPPPNPSCRAISRPCRGPRPRSPNAAAKCKTLLTGDPLDYDLLPPIKEGMCGTPAPVLLRAVGHDPKVTINPPAILSCPMADVLGEWLRDTVQPEAKAVFGSAVAKIQNSSSYVCRNRYAGAGTPLSEHALANAFDVSEFVLTNGVRISVLDHWPRVVATPTAPKPNSERRGDGAASAPAAEPKGGDRDGVVTAAKARPDKPPPVAAEPAPDPNPFDDHAAIAPPAEPEGGDRDGVVTAAKARPDEPPPVAAEPAPDPNPFDDHAAIAPPAEPEGGDRDAVVDAAKAEPGEPAPITAESAPDSKSQFITYLHEDACRRFGTVLGPNANEAHKDHFHLDMKKRRRASYCE